MEKILQGQERIKILTFGDAHIGSTTAILHPTAKSFDGVIYSQQPQNRMQKWLWKNLLGDITSIGTVDIFMDLGDNIDAEQQRAYGRALVDADIDNQKRWAVEILDIMLNLTKPRIFIGVTGTPYHNRGFKTNCADLEIYKELEKLHPSIQFILGDKLIVKIGQLIWSIAHPYETREYSVPPMEKLIAQHGREYLLGNTPRIDVFIRGHCHVFNFLKYRGKIYVMTIPCQQPTSVFSRERAYLTVRHPDVGILSLTQVEDTIIPDVKLHRWKE